MDSTQFLKILGSNNTHGYNIAHNPYGEDEFESVCQTILIK